MLGTEYLLNIYIDLQGLQRERYLGYCSMAGGGGGAVGGGVGGGQAA